MLRSKKICFGVFLVFSIMLGSFLNVSSDVSALEDFVYIQTQFHSFAICDDSSSSLPHCSDFSFLKIENTGQPFSRVDSGPVLNSALWGGLGAFNPIILSLSSLSSVNVTNFQGASGLVGDLNITYTLTNSFGVSPSGSISLTENGTYDVSQYAEAVVDVPPEVVQGDYHDDLISINNSILIVAAVGLVIYFFYAIYRMILGGRR